MFVRLFIFVIFIRSLQPVLNDVCSSARNESLCEQYSENNELLSCSGRLQSEYYNEITSSLLLCHWHEEAFDPQILSAFPNLEQFTLFRSSVKIISPFEDRPALQVLNISYNAVEYLSPSVFDKLRFLKILDLRYNQLHLLEANTLISLPNLQKVFLVGNQWYCGDNFLWITKQKNLFDKLILDIDSLTCKGSKYNGKPLKQVMNISETLNLECSEISHICTCTLEHVVRVGNVLRPMIMVNCSNQNLKSLPRSLPTYTSTLVVRGNMISSLEEFITNKKYYHLLNVYLDYNNISSINILEGSSLLVSFSALSLKGNKLSEVPIYVLEYAFQKHRNIASLFLSENPWKCDCIFTPTFKDFLAKYQSVIKDIQNVKCAYREGDENSLASILSLSKNKICHEAGISNISFLKILNIVLATMLIVVLCDFAYNYYMYKKYNRLPWIAHKLP